MTDAPTQTHSPIEDLAALLAGTAVFALGATLLATAGLPSGGTTGVALLIHYATGLGFGPLFFLVNVPFYALAALRLGWKLTLRTMAAVGLVAGFARLMPGWIGIDRIDPVFAAAMAGLLMGLGLLILFRHRTSLGGFNIVALYGQERLGLRAGWVQLGLDATVLVVSLLVVAPQKALIALLCAATLNLVLVINHRPGRYTGVS
jgi:uncharacterized membrane-anchored protein YitT (DUF2179 family)